MNLIALMTPLSLIKCLKIYLQSTFVFFCATSVVQIYFLHFIGSLSLFYLFYSVVLIKKKELNAYKYIFFIYL